MTSSTLPRHSTPGSWQAGRSGNPQGRPIEAATIRKRLMQDLSARVLDGDKAALEMFIRLEKAAINE